jgi:hypothetical protein
MILPEDGEIERNALLIFHPGLGKFPQQITESIAQGFSNHQWSVRIEAAHEYNSSPHTYDLLILVSPTSWWKPARAIKNYITDHPDLAGKKCFPVVTAMGQAKQSLDQLERWILYNQGEILDAKYYYTLAPNDKENYAATENVNLAKALARKAAENIAIHFDVD